MSSAKVIENPEVPGESCVILGTILFPPFPFASTPIRLIRFAIIRIRNDNAELMPKMKEGSNPDGRLPEMFCRFSERSVGLKDYLN